MPPPAKTARPRERLNLRIASEARRLIDRAAKARGQNRTDFILDAARRAAEDALLDRALTSVSTKPAKPNALLRATMRAPLPWKVG